MKVLQTRKQNGTLYLSRLEQFYREGKPFLLQGQSWPRSGKQKIAIA
jgi:hypothetical protein